MAGIFCLMKIKLKFICYSDLFVYIYILLKTTKMTKSEFLTIKLTGKKPEFKQLIGLTKSPQTSELIDFCVMMHPNQSRDAQGSNCNVYTDKSHFIYTIYTTHILKTNVYGNSKTLYKR